MKIETLSTLKINDLTQKQFNRAEATGALEENELYLTPDGEGLITIGTQSVVGQYNEEDADAAFIVGNGTDDTHRQNAFVIKQTGEIVPNVANALKKTLSGEYLVLNDLSPIPHTMDITLHEHDNLKNIEVRQYGKNIVNMEDFLGGALSKDANDTYTLESKNTYVSSWCYQHIPANVPLTISFKILGFANMSNSNLNLQIQTDNGKHWIDFPLTPSLGRVSKNITTKGNVTQMQLFIDNSNGKDAYVKFTEPQFEINTVETEYESYRGVLRYMPSSYGEIPRTPSFYPTTTLITNTSGAVMDCTYNQDINSALAKEVVTDAYMSNTDPVGTGSFSMNRRADSTIGNYSHTEGMSNIASGYASHAEGQNTNASGYASHAEGFDARTSGDYSHAEGEHTIASGYASHAEGGALFETDGNATWIEAYTEAEGDYSHAEGEGTKASGEASHAEGYGTTASGEASHAEGCNTTASGNMSHAEGNNTTAGHGCHTEGYGTTAITNQHVQGHWNNTSNMVMAGVSGTSGTAFVIGNGTNDSRSNAFRVDYSGEVYAASSSINTGADYAEFFEWQDANPNVEDRRGYFVTLDGEQIRIAQPNDYILGIVSGQPAVIGNGDEDWRGRYILDEFGAFIIEEFQYEEKVFDKETGETNTVIKTGTKYKENPEYDPSLPYVQRKDRPEWDAVGMIGVLSVRDDGTCKVNGFCKVAEGGIATTSENGYRVIKRVSDNIIKVIFK